MTDVSVARRLAEKVAGDAHWGGKMRRGIVVIWQHCDMNASLSRPDI
jgi:hypothetical protein